MSTYSRYLKYLLLTVAWAILQKKYRHGTGNRLNFKRDSAGSDSSSSSDGGRQLILRNGDAILVPFDCETLYRESKIAEDS